MLAALLLVGFYLYLRTGELMLLRVQDLMFAPSGKSCVLNLGYTKTGKRKSIPEQVTLRTPWLVIFLRLAVMDLRPGDYLWGGKTTSFRTRFDQALVQEDVKDMGFRPYSLRRGGATAAFQAGLSYNAIAETSRHSSLRSLKVYVNDALAEALSFRFTPAQRRRLDRRAADLHSLIG